MDPIKLVTPEIGLMFWTCVVFTLLLILLKKFAWKPILAAVDARNKSIEDALVLAKKTRDEMANLQEVNKKLLQEARTQRDEMLKEARDIKASIVSDAKHTAKAEADKMISSAKAVIENEKVAAISELKNSVGALSIEIAEKVLKSELKDVEKQKTFISEMLNDVKLN
jgi:F-type H+-transporting ATPase subunit b